MTLRLIQPSRTNRLVSSCVPLYSISPPAFHQTRRLTQQTSIPKHASSRSPLSPPFTFLLVTGIGGTAYGLYNVYQQLTLWPPEVRQDLRNGLKAKHKGDFSLSVQYLKRAWDVSKVLPISLFKSQPYLKTSGIALCLAEVLESDGKPEHAYDVYLDALTQLQTVATRESLSGPERLRAIAISYKLGEMAGILRRPEEEQHLVWAVEGILHSMMSLDGVDGRSVVDLESVSLPSDPETRTMIGELALPEWATKTDVAAPFEALGTFYSQNGKVEYAMSLYLQALSILIPPFPQSSSIENRCRGAQLMSNLSELIIRNQYHLSTKDLSQAEAWATKALDISMHARDQLRTRDPTCEVAFAVALFNIAAIRRASGDLEKAKEYFSLSLKQSRDIEMEEGVLHAEDALRQLEAVKPFPS